MIGGQVAVSWPGLNDTSLVDGQDLAITTDLRDVLVQLLERRLLDGSAAAQFPDFMPGVAPELFLQKT